MGAKEAKEEKQPAADEAPQSIGRGTELSSERSCAEALMMACDERLGAQSPAALMVCDTFLARDFWTSFVHQSFPPPVASQLWAWGGNRHGQLGIGSSEDRMALPKEATALHSRRIYSVACGMEHTLAVADEDELWATGSNAQGRLGLGYLDCRYVFTRVSVLSGRPVTTVACGHRFSLALLETGELLAWGDNTQGQLGLGDQSIERTTPEPVAALSGRRIAAIACGWGHAIAALETGELFSWGNNIHGQLGLGDNEHRRAPCLVRDFTGTRVASVFSVGDHSAAVLETCELFMWGGNHRCQLGLGDGINRNAPELVKALSGHSVSSVALGNVHTLALLKNGRVFAWGDNSNGELGLGSANSVPVSLPQRVYFFEGKRVKSVYAGQLFSGAVLYSGELFTWGSNGYGQLGIDGKMHDTATPMLVPALARKQVVSASFFATTAIALVK